MHKNSRAKSDNDLISVSLNGVDFKKHAGVISYFQREYVKTKIFDVKYSKYLSQAFQIRNNTD